MAEVIKLARYYGCKCFSYFCNCFSFIRGYHDYKDIWTPETGEVLEVEAEPSNPRDPMATAVKKNGQVVGHIPRSLACYTHFFLLRQDPLKE